MASPTSAPSVLAKLHESRKYSDFILVCHGKEIPVHKSVVCTRSPLMAAAYDGGFQEASTGRMSIEDFDLETVERMIEFMYTDNYEDGYKAFMELNLDNMDSTDPKDTNKMTNLLLLNANMNVIGNYYDIPELRQLAVQKYETAFPHTTPDAFPEFLAKIDDGALDNDFRVSISEGMVRHLDYLRDDEDFKNTSFSSNLPTLVMLELYDRWVEERTLRKRKVGELEKQLHVNRRYNNYGY
jgi:hypothetical protein